MAFLDQNPGIGYPAAGVLGLMVGSFLNVVILRLPKWLDWQYKHDAREALGEPNLYEPPPPGVVVEPSHCPQCKHALNWYENIPLFSWLFLRGKCRHCHAPISFQYPFVELLTALLALASVWQFGFGWHGFGAVVLSCFLIALSGIDVREQLLPDNLTLPLMWLGLVGSMDNLYMPAKPALIGAAAGYVSLWLVWWLFKQITGKEGMGHGDFKLLAALGAWCGWKGILPIVLISSLVGAVTGSLWLWINRKKVLSTPIPFGVYLAIAGWLVFMWGDGMIAAYRHWAGLG